MHFIWHFVENLSCQSFWHSVKETKKKHYLAFYFTIYPKKSLASYLAFDLAFYLTSIPPNLIYLALCLTSHLTS